MALTHQLHPGQAADFSRSATDGEATHRLSGAVEGDVLVVGPSGVVTTAALRAVVYTTPAGGTPTERVRVDHLGGLTLVEEFALAADPAAPTAGGRLYCVQTAGGKTQLAVIFPSGAAQILATEP